MNVKALNYINPSNKESLPEIKFIEFADYLHIRVSSETHTLKGAKIMWVKMVEECRKRGFTKLLVEKNIRSSLTAIEMFELMSFLAKNHLYDLKMGLFDREAGHAEVNKFGELVGFNRGLNGRVFENKEEAVKWLLED